MNNYIEYDDKIAFHPGYYIKEIIEESGLTQADFAKRLDTTPKNLSLLIRGEQSLSLDIAMKLSRMIGTSVSYWLNLQSAYDILMADFEFRKELEQEKQVLRDLGYNYFSKYFNLPNLSRKTEAQVAEVRRFLNVSTLTAFRKRDMAVSFRSATGELSEANIIKANTMVQIAVNMALKIKAPPFNKTRFKKAAEYALTLTQNYNTFYPCIKEAFCKAGVIFVILPNIPGSKINGATKKIGNNIVLLVNDRRLKSDTFWFTLFHEIGHVMYGDYGISFDLDTGKQEELADKYAEDMLIPYEQYQKFIEKNRFDVRSIQAFAENINRAPEIVLGRLLNDGKVKYNDLQLNVLHSKLFFDWSDCLS